MEPFLEEAKINKNASGKNIESLKKSEKIRSNFVLKYGTIPTSILKHDRKEISEIAIKEKRRYIDTQKPAKRSKRFGISGSGARSGALSTFPQSIGRLIVDFYCPKGGIVYDPFAGHNSRMELVNRSNRHYTGVDLSKKFMNANREIKEKLLNNQNFFKLDKTIKLIEGTSAKVNLPNDYADFTITSPPYWDIEYYGNESEQLGKAKTYNNFLKLISENIKENLRILKPGSFCAWFVNDFVKNKIFYPYHADLMLLFINVGFEPFQVYIVDLGFPPMGYAFTQTIINTKRFPKQHEYCLLFKKPNKRINAKKKSKQRT